MKAKCHIVSLKQFIFSLITLSIFPFDSPDCDLKITKGSILKQVLNFFCRLKRYFR